MERDRNRNNQSFINYTWFVAVFVFVVIAAGGIVRTTQSGMGCPDWPTCFGKWIPPTNSSQLPPDFEKYLRQQDIDHTFNVYHTWVEYLNRDVAALLGIFLFILSVWAFRKFFKNHRRIFWWSAVVLVLTGFQAWLGKKVVDSNLAALKITAHMLIGLAIAAIPLYIIYLLRQKPLVQNKTLKWLLAAALLTALVQIVMGTQVREQVDEISRSLFYQQRNLWIERLGTIFIVHRSFSWIVLLLALLVFIKAYKLPGLQSGSRLVAILAGSSIALGVVMAFLHIPAWAQPLHLLTGTLLVLTLFHLRLRVK